MTKKASSPSLEKLGLHSSLDCVLHLPIRYEDETKLSTIGQAVGAFGGLTLSEVKTALRRPAKAEQDPSAATVPPLDLG